MKWNNQKTISELELAQALKDAAAMWPTRLELFAHVAKEKKAQYDAYIEAGFTADQALVLCK